MKGFALTDNNDVAIQNNEIQMINGVELTQQTIKTVLQTDKGEWFLNENEGIDFNAILGKKRYVKQNAEESERYIKLKREINTERIENSQLADEILELQKQYIETDGDS